MDRQLSRAKGDWKQRAKTIRSAQNVMVAAIAINLVLVVGQNLITGIYDRRLSVALGAFWLGLSYFVARQRKHLNNRVTQGSSRKP